MEPEESASRYHDSGDGRSGDACGDGVGDPMSNEPIDCGPDKVEEEEEEEEDGCDEYHADAGKRAGRDAPRWEPASGPGGERRGPRVPERLGIAKLPEATGQTHADVGRTRRASRPNDRANKNPRILASQKQRNGLEQGR